MRSFKPTIIRTGITWGYQVDDTHGSAKYSEFFGLKTSTFICDNNFREQCYLKNRFQRINDFDSCLERDVSGSYPLAYGTRYC
jgi:hypothetical protein